MLNITEYLPFIIPLVIAQLGLMALSLWHILTHDKYKCGNRVLWVIIVVIVNFIGPILYFAFGKED